MILGINNMHIYLNEGEFCCITLKKRKKKEKKEKKKNIHGCIVVYLFLTLFSGFFASKL